MLLRSLCLLLLCCLLSGCNDYGQPDKAKLEPAAQPKAGGVYRIPLLNNPKSLDPSKAEDQYSAAVVYQLFDGLVQFSPDLLVIPALAENWRIEQEGLVYHFFLRKDALFHDNSPVTSKDVLFSLGRLIRTRPAPSILPHLLKISGADEYRARKAEQLAGVEIIGEREFLIRLEVPYAPFLAALGMYQTRIVPRDGVSQRGDDFYRNPVGSGAFQFVSWEDDKSVRLRRFPGYYQGAALLDEIRYVIYPGGRIEQALSDFLDHKLDEMPVHGSIRQKLQSHGDIQWIHRPSPSLLFYGMNCNHPLLRKTGVRRALSMAIDRERLVSTVYGGQFVPARSLLPPGIMGYNPEHLEIVDDPAEAKKLFDEQAGSGEPSADRTLEVVSAIQSPTAKAELEFIAECWSRLGITLQIKFIPDWAEFERYVRSPSMQLYRYAWFMDIPDPDNILQVLFGSDSSVNFMQYINPDVDRMLREARVASQPSERASIYHKIEDEIVSTLPLVPLVHLSIDQVYQPNVRGITLNALAGHKALYQVWLLPAEK